jgi:hypothetical protein
MQVDAGERLACLRCQLRRARRFASQQAPLGCITHGSALRTVFLHCAMMLIRRSSTAREELAPRCGIVDARPHFPSDQSTNELVTTASRRLAKHPSPPSGRNPRWARFKTTSFMCYTKTLAVPKQNRQFIITLNPNRTSWEQSSDVQSQIAVFTEIPRNFWCGVPRRQYQSI